MLFQTSSPQRFLTVKLWNWAVGAQNYLYPNLKGNKDFPESSVYSTMHEQWVVQTSRRRSSEGCHTVGWGKHWSLQSSASIIGLVLVSLMCIHRQLPFSLWGLKEKRTSTTHVESEPEETSAIRLSKRNYSHDLVGKQETHCLQGWPKRRVAEVMMGTKRPRERQIGCSTREARREQRFWISTQSILYLKQSLCSMVLFIMIIYQWGKIMA